MRSKLNKFFLESKIGEGGDNKQEIILIGLKILFTLTFKKKFNSLKRPTSTQVVKFRNKL